MADTTACQDNPDRWFSDDYDDLRAAKAACRKCPIRQQCEELGWDEVHGVWGGLSERDRKKRGRARYAAAQARAVRESAEFEVVIAGVIERLQKQRQEGVVTEEGGDDPDALRLGDLE